MEILVASNARTGFYYALSSCQDQQSPACQALISFLSCKLCNGLSMPLASSKLILALRLEARRDAHPLIGFKMSDCDHLPLDAWTKKLADSTASESRCLLSVQIESDKCTW